MEEEIPRRTQYEFLSLPYALRTKFLLHHDLIEGRDEGQTAAEVWRRAWARAKDREIDFRLTREIAAMYNQYRAEQEAQDLAAGNGFPVKVPVWVSPDLTPEKLSDILETEKKGL